MSKHNKNNSSLPPEEKEPKLLKEEMDESRQEIEEAGYAVGLNRDTESPSEESESKEWVNREKEAEDELE